MEKYLNQQLLLKQKHFFIQIFFYNGHHHLFLIENSYCLTKRQISLRKHSRICHDYKSKSFFFLNPQAPVAQKTANEVVFRRFQGEGVEFFKIGPH